MPSIDEASGGRDGLNYNSRLNELRGIGPARSADSPRPLGALGSAELGEEESDFLVVGDSGNLPPGAAGAPPSPGDRRRAPYRQSRWAPLLLRLRERWVQQPEYREREVRVGGNPDEVPRWRTVAAAAAGIFSRSTRPRDWRVTGQNAVCNQKYSLISFLPLVLYEQFRLFYNLFFLGIALTQLIPALRVGLIWSYFGPLAFVLLVSISKEFVDEYHRYKRDHETNNRKYTLLVDNPVNSEPLADRVPVASRDIKVGDVLLLESNDRVPADVILLRAHPTDGQGDSLFIRTDQLDGETDWKMRRAVHTTQAMSSDLATLQSMGDRVYAEAPRKEIYDFTGNYIEESGHVESLSLENTMWANTVLAAGTAVVMAVYVGKETRSMMNASQPGSKIGKLDLELNYLSKWMFSFLLLFSFTLTAFRGFYGHWYLYFFRYFLLLSYIIPISLRINLDMAKLVYKYMIEQDFNRMQGAIVRTSDLPEELGRVEYLLSDKTGTLTQNEMVFKKLHLGAVLFGKDSLEDIRRYARLVFATERQSASAAGQSSHQSPTSPISSSPGPSIIALENGITASQPPSLTPGIGHSHMRIQTLVRDAILGIFLAHNVTPVEENGIRDFQAASPDEIALVKFAEDIGMRLQERTASRIVFRTPADTEIVYHILYEFPFTSDAKRMGIIVRESVTGVVTLYVKGADSVMAKIVRYNDWLEEECGNLARDGLRTLVYGKRVLDADELMEFEDQWRNAKTQLYNRKEAMAAAQCSIENKMELIALTGVEDKLQPHVRESLEKLRHAGIRVWMLTGDKVETATCIAISSRLAERGQGISTIVGVDSRTEASRRLSMFRRVASSEVLVIDGASLQVFLDHFPSDFMEVASMSPSVVASRCSPTQKAAVVRLLKSHTSCRVAAIGDGGNDVSMIQEANVGIGIPGKEGKQASLAADFSIATFSHLTRLMMWHGRNSYKRSARMAQFVMHRGLIISVIQLVYSSLFFYAAVSQYDSWILVGYATVFTMFPVFSLVLDQDVTESAAETYPELYRDLQKGRSLNLKTFLVWVFKSIYQGTAIMLLSVWLQDDKFFTLLHLSAVSFTALILTELLMVALEVHTWHWIMPVAEACSMFCYLVSIFVLSDTFDRSVMFRPAFLAKVVIVTLVSCLPVTIGKFLNRKLAPPAYSKVA